MAVPLPDVDDEALVSRRILVRAKDVVFVRGVIEASEGLANMFAQRGGDLVLVASVSREAELDEIVEDLRVEVGATVTEPVSAGGRRYERSLARGT
ncbi:MAG: DUF4911 domain-containing protein [Polyangiaceae bacterium]|jgi:hypothetical protein|nr:DUF4911 domain-containing protein [Polyangiaceae bacterium]